MKLGELGKRELGLKGIRELGSGELEGTGELEKHTSEQKEFTLFSQNQLTQTNDTNSTHYPIHNWNVFHF